MIVDQAPSLFAELQQVFDATRMIMAQAAPDAPESYDSRADYWKARALAAEAERDELDRTVKLLSKIQTDLIDERGALIRERDSAKADVDAVCDERDALLALLGRFVELCAVGDVDETTEALGWGELIAEAKTTIDAAQGRNKG